MVSWSVELLEFDIQYEPRTTIKAQVLADFLAEMVEDEQSQESRWTLYVDGASGSKGSGAGVIVEKEGETIVEISIKFDFPISNYKAEYKALIAGLN